MPTLPAPVLRRRRAAPLPPAERRADIIHAVLPLLIEHGAAVTSRELAAAAGVSEGTIFRVFADKDELFAAAFETAVDQAPARAAICRDRSDRAVRAATDRRDRADPTAHRRHLAARVEARPPTPSRTSQAAARQPGPRRAARYRSTTRLRTEPIDAARLLRALTLSSLAPDARRRTETGGRHRRRVPPRCGGGLVSLRRLLRSHLGPYRKTLLRSWSCSRRCRPSATLALPTLNADLIDNGVLAGDTGYIWRIGAVMLGFSLVQIVFAVVAVCFGATRRDGLRSRRASRPVPPGHRLLGPRGRRVRRARRSSPASPTTCSRCRCSS